MGHTANFGLIGLQAQSDEGEESNGTLIWVKYKRVMATKFFKGSGEVEKTLEFQKEIYRDGVKTNRRQDGDGSWCIMIPYSMLMQ